MYYGDLIDGHRIEYKFKTVTKTNDENIEKETETIQWANSPIYTRKMDLNVKLDELSNREDVLEITVFPVKTWRKEE